MDYALRRTEHQRAVDRLLEGIGHPVPAEPKVASNERLATWARLLLEEVWEYIDACNIKVKLAGDRDDDAPLKFEDLVIQPGSNPDLVGIVDAAADVQVVSTGCFSLCGVADKSVLEEVDSNNLLKLKNGRLDPESGKFIKPPNHPKPNFEAVLRQQGWKPTKEEANATSNPL